MSGGTWSQADAQNTSTRPGIYINFVGQATLAVQTGAQGTVAIPGTSDWGLLNGVTTLTAEDQVTAALGTGGNLPLLASQALRGGAAQVLAYRIGVAGTVAKAATTLNAADASGAAILLTAKYEGIRANSFTVKVSTNSDPSKKDLTILEGSTVLEAYTHVANDDLAGMINGTIIGINPSRYVSATVQGSTGRTLANNGAGALMTGGNSGTSITATEYDAARTALETQDFNLYVPGDTTNTSIQASVRAWVDRLRNEGKKVIAVMGGQSVAGFSSSAAKTEFDSLRAISSASTVGNHEGVVYCYPGIVDELSGQSLSGAQSAARAAGMIAQAGFASSVTQSATGASDVTARLSTSDIKLGLQSGLFLFTVSGQQVVVEQGINTLTTFTLTKGRNFRKIRLIRTIDAIATTISTAAVANIIGKVNNNADGQTYTIGLILQALDIFKQAGAVEPGFTAVADTANMSHADPDEFFVIMAVTPIDSMEKVFITARVL